MFVNVTVLDNSSQRYSILSFLSRVSEKETQKQKIKENFSIEIDVVDKKYSIEQSSSKNYM